MRVTIQEFTNRLDRGVDKVRQLSDHFCHQVGVTAFAYVRVYKNEQVSWVTSTPDQDRFLIESGALDEDPLVDTPDALAEGPYLWFNERQFPGCEAFYQERARRFQMDHGLVVVAHQKDYLETCTFSGLLAKRPLYNLFLRELALFESFMGHFTSQLDRHLENLLNDGLKISDLKTRPILPKLKPLRALQLDPKSLAEACGHEKLLMLSRRERESLCLLKLGLTYQAIGKHLGLSARTVEHYLDSAKFKLGLETRSDLFRAAEQVSALGLD